MPNITNNITSSISSSIGDDDIDLAPFRNLLTVQLDASNPDPFGPSIADAAELVSWKDLSGNGNHAIQTTSTKRFTFRKSDTLAPSGLPALRSDGIDDSYWIPSLQSGTNFTIFVAGKFTNNDILTQQAFVELGADVNFNSGFYIYGGGTERTFINNAGAKLGGGNDVNWLGENPVIGTAFYNSLDLRTRKNGVDQGGPTVGIGTSTFTDNLSIGTRNAIAGGSVIFTKGDWFEVLIYNPSLTIAQIEIVESYLKNKWGIA